VDELIILAQPAHLQRLAGEPLGAEERNVTRARLVRDRLAAAEHEPGIG
jgi:protein arginine kinase